MNNAIKDLKFKKIISICFRLEKNVTLRTT